jgi:hypothetical protein
MKCTRPILDEFSTFDPSLSAVGTLGWGLGLRFGSGFVSGLDAVVDPSEEVYITVTSPVLIKSIVNQIIT